LDATRFIAALLVFADHACGSRISGGFGWQLADYGPEAVAVFFVLSGFVIAHATASRELSPQSYAVARGARIYSVALPALVFTAIADAIGRSVSPALYSGPWHAALDWHFLGAAAFVNELWTVSFNPGSDWSYWSLGYEVWYYAIFGALAFAPRRFGLLAAAGLLLLVGPSIAALFPLWLVGVGAYRVCTRHPMGRTAGLLLFLGSLAAWGAYEVMAWRHGRFLLRQPEMLVWLKRPELPQYYVVGLAFAGSLIGFRSASEWIEPFAARHRFAALRWAAGATLSIYLFHEPLLRLLATLNPWPPGSWRGRTLVLGGTLIVVFALAELTERRKGAWRRGILALVERAKVGAHSRAVAKLSSPASETGV